MPRRSQRLGFSGRLYLLAEMINPRDRPDHRSGGLRPVGCQAHYHAILLPISAIATDG